MQQIPGNISNEDLNQWLQHSYFYHREPKTAKFRLSILCHIPQPNGGILNGIQHLDNNEMIPMPSPDELYCHWPVGGAINWPSKHYAVYAERLPKKQWKRSYIQSYYSIKKLGGLTPSEVSLYRSTTGAAKDMMEPVYYSYSTIKKELFPLGWESAAITPQLTIIGGDIQKIYFNTNLVGKITQDNQLYINNRTLQRYIFPHFDGLVRY